MPKGTARRPTAWPIRPAPNRPRVRPRSSIPSSSSGCHPAHDPPFTNSVPVTTWRAHARINAHARSAVASGRASGGFVALTRRISAATTSPFSCPAAQVATIFSFGGGVGSPPAVPQEAARHVTRGTLGALGVFLPVSRCLGPPRRVGVQLRDGVLLLLVRRGRSECRRLLPLVLQHQTLRRTLGVHRDPAALAYLGGLLGGRLEAAEGGQGHGGGEPRLGPAHPDLRRKATGTDRVGFEPTVPLRAHRFSRPAVSTAHAPVH